MNLYVIGDRLRRVDMEQALKREAPYVALATAEEFENHRDLFDMGIDLDLDLVGEVITKAEVNFDSLIGTFQIPDRKDLDRIVHRFAFALDEKGIVFVNDDGYAQSIIDEICRVKRWKFPSLERFLFDFLELIAEGDLALLQKFEVELDSMEDAIQKKKEKTENVVVRLVDIRKDIQKLRLNYEQMLDLTQELEENENSFFEEKNLRYFGLYETRLQGLLDIVSSIKDHTIQVRELYHTMLDERQNNNMAILTIVATIFMPLTLMVGWYGMNFTYMPELEYVYAYPVFALISLIVIVLSVIYFKRKKWF